MQLFFSHPVARLRHLANRRRAETRSGDQLNVIVFSKDRAAQLDLLLRSIGKWFDTSRHVRLTVLFTASSDAYSQGYDLVRRLHPEIRFRDERIGTDGFKMCTLAVTDSAIPYTMFLVDDDVFKNPFSLEDEEFERFTKESGQLCLSLRLGKHITYCYPMDIGIATPHL